MQGLAPRGGNDRVAAILPSSERPVAQMIEGTREKYGFCLSRVQTGASWSLQGRVEKFLGRRILELKRTVLFRSISILAVYTCRY